MSSSNLTSNEALSPSVQQEPSYGSICLSAKHDPSDAPSNISLTSTDGSHQTSSIAPEQLPDAPCNACMSNTNPRRKSISDQVSRISASAISMLQTSASRIHNSSASKMASGKLHNSVYKAWASLKEWASKLIPFFVKARLMSANADGEPVQNGDPGGTSRKFGDYPYSIFFILSNEFCERFCYYGMRAVLVLYLTNWLSFEESKATSMFHGFSMLSYIMPLFGAVLADGFLGRYKTILILSCVYFIGNLILALTAIPPPESFGPTIGLLLIAVGTGGIKASVAPFGADQFEPHQTKAQISFFSAFYFMINLGSMISVLVTPILRADVQCFGKDCYLLAFGLPAVLMFISLMMFYMGRNLYKIVPPSENTIGKTFMCIFYGVKGQILSRKSDERPEHWLYHAEGIYDHVFIENIRRLLQVLIMFLPMPIFWALSGQQGSRWTLQAEHMDGNLGVFGSLKPDQMQALNPILILVLIPLFDKVVYPCMDVAKIPNRPLQRMVVGLFLSSLAFICAGLVQLKIDHAEDPVLNNGEGSVAFMNGASCSIKINAPFYKDTVDKYHMSEYVHMAGGKYPVEIHTMCKSSTLAKQHSLDAELNFDHLVSYRLIIFMNSDGKLSMQQYQDKRKKPKKGNSALSIFATTDDAAGLIMLVGAKHNHDKTDKDKTFEITKYTATDFMLLEPGMYSIFKTNIATNEMNSLGLQLNLGVGGVYTAFIRKIENDFDVTLFTDLPANSVSMLWLVPQYFLITVGEVLFAINSQSFAYSQAPESMKSVVQAILLTTVAFGDLVVIIVANLALGTQMSEFFFFASMMFVDAILFAVMATFYHYKPNTLSYVELNDDVSELTSDFDELNGETNMVETVPLAPVKN